MDPAIDHHVIGAQSREVESISDAFSNAVIK